MNFNEKIALGRTGLKAGQLGIASSFGAPAEAYEEAFDRGCNYFTLGTFIKGRSSHMKTAISNICKKGHRENLIVVMITYAHNARLTNHFLYRDMRNLGIDYTDILLLGYFNKRPNQRIIDGAMQLKENGLVRYIGLTSHKRTLFPKLTDEGLFEIFHIRYNAAHRGA